jgi:hypothetical protein
MSQYEVPWWAKTLLYIGLPIGALIVVYKLASDWLSGPLNNVKELWQQQYNDYLKELKEFSEQTGGNLTTEQLTILDRKEAAMKQTQETYVQIAQGTYGLLATCFAIAVAGLVAFGLLSKVVNKWQSKTQGQVQSTIGQDYICALGIADDLAERGYTTQATALATTMKSQFASVYAPYMQAEITRFQNSIPTLTGWELMYASYMVNAYTVELAAIPIWFTYLVIPV